MNGNKVKLRRQIAPPLLALSMIAFSATWFMNPDTFAITVVGLGMADLAIGGVGLFMRAMRPGVDTDTRSLVVDIALVVLAFSALAVARTINGA